MKKRVVLTLLFIVSPLLLLTGCAARKQSIQERNDIIWDQSQVEARLYDVPLLVGAHSIELMTDMYSEENSILSYTSGITSADALLFYQEQLERMGWKRIATFSSEAESLLIFEKPQKYCSISFRPQKKETHIIVFVGQKV